MFSYIGIVVFLFALLLSDLPVTYPQDIDQLCSVSGSGITDKSRFGVIRDEILAKLNLFLPLDTTEALSNDSSQLDRPRQIDPALVRAYEVAARVGADPKASGCSDSDSGRGTPSFAKRISLFFPENSSLAYLPPELLTSHRHKNEQDDTKASSSDNASISRSTPPIQYNFEFNLSLPAYPNVLYSAELRLFKKITSKCNRDKELTLENVEVFYVSRKGVERERILVTSKNVEVHKDEYDSFNVTEAVSMWIDSGSNASLELEVVVNCPFSTTSGLFYPPSIAFTTDQESEDGVSSTLLSEKRAQLVVATIQEEVATELERKRKKRSQSLNSEYCDDNPNQFHCCIHKLEVDFHRDLNLTFILYPYTFTPNYCHGLCPIPFRKNFVQMSIEDYYQQNDIGEEPCCTIHSIRSLLVIIQSQGDDSFIMAEIQNMEIQSCGCV